MGVVGHIGRELGGVNESLFSNVVVHCLDIYAEHRNNFIQQLSINLALLFLDSSIV